MKPILILMFLAAAGITYIFWNAHKDDAELRSQCESMGGVFVEAREPPHFCAYEPPRIILRSP